MMLMLNKNEKRGFFKMCQRGDSQISKFQGIQLMLLIKIFYDCYDVVNESVDSIITDALYFASDHLPVIDDFISIKSK